MFGAPAATDVWVAVAGTRADGLAGHAVVATSHIGLLLSDRAARLSAQFLRDGRFEL